MCVTVLCFCLNLAWKWLIIPVNLTFTTLWFNSPDNKLIIFFLFFTDTYFIGFGIPCKLSPKETTCMKYWSLFLGKKKKNIIKLSSAEFSHKVVKVNLTLKAPRKTASENVVCLCHLLNILADFSNRQTVWTQIRKEQSDLGPHCLQKWLLK